jgi:hypothetical protein
MQGHHRLLAAFGTASRRGEESSEPARREIEAAENRTRGLADSLHEFGDQRSGRRR